MTYNVFSGTLNPTHFTNFTSIKCSTNIQVNLFTTFHIHSVQLRHASNKVYTHERGKLVQT